MRKDGISKVQWAKIMCSVVCFGVLSARLIGSGSDKGVGMVELGGVGKASYGTVAPEVSNAYFLNQLTLKEYEEMRDTLSFQGFLYVGWINCPYCKEFSPILQQVLTELDMLDEVRAWDIEMHWEDGVSDSILEAFGVQGVPNLLYFTAGGSIRRYDMSTEGVDGLKDFLR
jgi:hypothetical protein